MLCLWKPNTDIVEHSISAQNGMFVGWMPLAADVCETKRLNEDWTLSFSYPRNDRLSEALREPFAVVELDGHMFIAESITSTSDELDKISCRHAFFRDTSKMHVPNLGSTDTSDTIGIKPMVLAQKAFSESGCYVSDSSYTVPSNQRYSPLGQEAAQALGMCLLGEDPETTIDWESTDKTTVLDILSQIIENSGEGELYIGKNRVWAIVKRIGEDKNIILNTANFATNISIAKNYSDIVTRLYVYGKDDLTIANAEKNTSKTVYINSPNIGIYPLCEGYKEYSDIEDPDKLFERALWETDEDNPNRIDMPKITVTATVAALSAAGGRTLDISLGDGLWIYDLGTRYYVRCIEMSHYPFEPGRDSLILGTPEKDSFFFLNQLGKLAARYKNISTYKGAVQGTKVSGTVLKLGNCTLQGKSDGLYVNGVKVS